MTITLPKWLIIFLMVWFVVSHYPDYSKGLDMILYDAFGYSDWEVDA